jgi:hypothetical protein
MAGLPCGPDLVGFQGLNLGIERIPLVEVGGPPQVDLDLRTPPDGLRGVAVHEEMIGHAACPPAVCR